MELSSQIEFAIEFTIEGETPTRKSRSSHSDRVRCAEGRAVLKSCRYHGRSWRRQWPQGEALRRRVAKFQTGSGNTVLRTIYFGPGLLLVRTSQLTPSPLRPSTPRRQISSPNMAVVAGAIR